MKVTAVVPIKLNNVRLPNKNIRSFDNGKPLIRYILDTLINIDLIDDIYVYCSDESICKYIPSKVKYLKRNNQLDSNDTKINEVLLSFAKDIESDIYVLAHATAPFIKSTSIEVGLINVINDKYDSSLSVIKMQDFIWQENKPVNYKLSSIPRTQDLKPIYKETSGFYIYKREHIIEHNRRIGYNPYLVEVSKIEGVDIDNEEDFDIANSIYNYMFKQEVK